MHGTAANLHHPDLKGVTYLFGEVCGGMGNLRRLNLGASLETGLHLNRNRARATLRPSLPLDGFQKPLQQLCLQCVQQTGTSHHQLDDTRNGKMRNEDEDEEEEERRTTTTTTAAATALKLRVDCCGNLHWD